MLQTAKAILSALFPATTSAALQCPALMLRFWCAVVLTATVASSSQVQMDTSDVVELVATSLWRSTTTTRSLPSSSAEFSSRTGCPILPSLS